jgi:transcriptional regulator with XRE-family HTH domain
MQPQTPDVARLYAVIGENVRSIRERAGLSRDDLAARVGISKTSIAQFEGGYQRLPLETIYLIAYALSVGIVALLPALEELVATGTPLLSKVANDETLDTGERKALLQFLRQYVK